ncbi:AraC family transcriptional regulator [Streptomyces pluripotens]|uniref:AraC family transcriptional regulator n=1 Tax=Streptomyces pluripotens TaxID=1355015 RepID=A0A221NSY2_9ACTN|nr:MULTISPECIES: helix-turn-helix domain-containing protein [Streptomyces]ARP68788.1 AraC family transcriptional regulator [Streptomyces pluripotens]ASN23044.1 AraC family transcriptional regulator [Streptomyces pluripotens]KIE27816.1 AraC family transcriptional regulator [Streptomyces sp. MUSC 125]MCH0558477.1 helix-turn-helix domain-containing protein [Streptomyces sp. MUM 16J]
MRGTRTPERVVVLALDGVYPFELGIPSRVFGAADGHYEVLTCTVDGRPVRTESDFTVGVAHGPEILKTADTVVVASMPPDRIPAELPDEVATALASIRPGARIVSICTAAFVLAAAGLLDGRRATTHWQVADLFRRRFPQVDLDPDVLFVTDGRILTSAGAASGVDVCLHIVRTDHGSELANTVARRCVVPPFRDGGQAQYIDQPVPADGATGTAATRDWALEHLSEPLTLMDLAEHARMSRRTFVRRFNAEVGLSPGRWLIQQRVVRARHLLESSDLPVDRIATEVGFATGASLRQHLHTAIGVSPQAYRRTFRQVR